MTHPILSAGRATRLGIGLAGLLVAVTLYRGWALQAADLQLYFDEAYYWYWSTRPAFGYYSKPPMIAWLMHAMSAVCGETEPCLRAGSLLLFPATTALIAATATRLFDARGGFFAGLVYLTLPVVAFYSWMMTTDALLSFFWALALFGLSGALQSHRWRDWLLTGAAVGLGLLSKYTMLVFVPSVLAVWLWVPEWRRNLRGRKPVVAVLLAAGLFAPNLFWNLSHGNPSFRHTAEIAHWGGQWFHPDRLAIFVGGQILLFGPPLAIVCVVAGWKARRAVCLDPRNRFLLGMTLPMLGLIGAQALIAKANLNWAMTAFVPAAVLAASVAQRFLSRRTLLLAVTFNALAGVAIYHYGAVAMAFGLPLSQKTDAYAAMKGWRELGQRVGEILANHPGAGLASDNRRLLAELVYYVHPHPLDAVIWNPTGKISDHFRLTADLRDGTHESYLFVADEADANTLRPHFAEVTELDAVEVRVHADLALRHRVFLVRDFQGY